MPKLSLRITFSAQLRVLPGMGGIQLAQGHAPPAKTLSLWHPLAILVQSRLRGN